MIKRAIATTAVLAITGFGVQAASAEPGGKKPRFDAEASVTYSASEMIYEGTVTAQNAKCMRNRSVTVVELLPEISDRRGGPPPTENNDRPTTVGVDRTNKDGEFKVKASVPDPFTRYRVRVQQSVRNKYICNFTVSPTGTYLPL